MTTKAILFCAISLGIAVLVKSVAEYAKHGTPIQLPKEECDRFLKNINDKKREMVKQLNISDGYELTWDSKLVEEIGETFRNVGVLMNSKNRISYGGQSLDALFEYRSFPLTKDEGESYQNIESFLTPIHKTIGCAGHRWTGHVGIFCSLEPGLASDGAQLFDTYRGFYGVPGSNCTAGYANHDGLCALIGSFTTEKPLTKPPVKPTSEPKNKESAGVTDVTSGSSSTSILIGFFLFGVSFFLSY